jgi:hypothetical protein
MTTTLDSGTATATIDTYRDLFKSGHKFLHSTFAATPDDKLNWKPTPSAKSALQIAAHVAAANQYFILAYGGKPPVTDFAEIFVWMDKWADERTTREQVVADLKRTEEELDTVFANFAPEMLDNEDAKLGLWISSFHAMEHSSQIDYLQTCWGDKDFHMPN